MAGKSWNVVAAYFAIHLFAAQAVRIKMPGSEEVTPWKNIQKTAIINAELATKVARVEPNEEKRTASSASPFFRPLWTALEGTWFVVQESDMDNVLKIAAEELNAARHTLGCKPNVNLLASRAAYGQEASTRNYRFVAAASVGTDPDPVDYTALGILVEIDERSEKLKTSVQVLGNRDACSLIDKRNLFRNGSAFLQEAEEAASMMPRRDGIPYTLRSNIPEGQSGEVELLLRHPPPPKDGIPAAYNVLTDHVNAAKCFGNATSGHEILDQGSCGCCFVMSATSVSGDRLCLNDVHSQHTHPSAQHYLSCYQAQTGCDGGKSYYVYNALKNSGLAHAEDLPYKVACWKKDTGGVVNDDFNEECAHGEWATMPDTDKCASREYDDLEKSYSFDIYTIRRSLRYAHPRHNVVHAIQSAILEGGPVDSSMRIFNDFRIFFKHFPKSVYVHDRVATQGGGHSVVLLGWGENGGKDEWKDVWKDGLPYWHCRNSWGTAWADGGYFKVVRGWNMVGIESSVNYPRMRTAPYPEGVMPERLISAAPKWEARNHTEMATAFATLTDEQLFVVRMDVSADNLKEEKFQYRLSRDSKDGEDVNIFVPLTVTFDILCRGFIGAPFKDERHDDCSLTALSLRIEGTSDWKPCDETTGCEFKQSYWSNSLWKVRMEMDIASEFNGARSLEFNVEGSSSLKLKDSGRHLGLFDDKVLKIGLTKRATEEPIPKIPFRTLMQVHTDSPKSKATAKIQLTLSCSRPCQVKSIKILNYNMRVVTGWNWDKSPWKIHGTSLHNIRSDKVDDFIHSLSGRREIYVEWKLISLDDDGQDEHVVREPYRLHEVFGEPVAKCKAMPYKIRFGEPLGHLVFNLPQEEAGIKKMSCAEFGAPAYYKGTCSFECDGEEWAMVGDACSCTETQCKGLEYTINLGADDKAVFPLPFLDRDTETPPMNCIRYGASRRNDGTCAFKCNADGRWSIADGDKCTCVDNTKCPSVDYTYTINFGSDGKVGFKMPPTKLGEEISLNCIAAGAPRHMDGTCTFECGHDRKWKMVDEKCSCQDETQCRHIDYKFKLNLGEDGTAFFKMPITKLGAETPPMSCVDAGAPSHRDGTCTFQCRNDRRWGVVKDKCSCEDETKCRGREIPLNLGSGDTAHFQLPSTELGKEMPMNCIAAGAPSHFGGSCTFKCGSDRRWSFVKDKCSCEDETMCPSHDFTYRIDFGSEGKFAFKMPPTKLSTETAPLSCIGAGAPSHMDGTCVFKCGSNRRWSLVEEKCSCRDETKCRGSFTVRFGGELGDLKFRLPVSSPGRKVVAGCKDAGGKQDASTCAFKCGSDFKYQLLDNECNCWDR